jgi:hypothetical protein
MYPEYQNPYKESPSRPLEFGPSFDSAASSPLSQGKYRPILRSCLCGAIRATAELLIELTRKPINYTVPVRSHSPTDTPCLSLMLFVPEYGLISSTRTEPSPEGYIVGQRKRVSLIGMIP